MKIYFYDESMKLISSRELDEGEAIPPNSTTNEVILKDGEEAHYQNRTWIISKIATEQPLEEEKTETQKLSARVSAVEEATTQILNLI